MAQSSFDSVAIQCVLLWMTLCFHIMGRMGGRTGTALCKSHMDMAAGRACTTAAHWLAGSVGRLAGARRLGRALVVWQLDSVLPGSVVHISPCSELCTGAKSAIYDGFVAVYNTVGWLHGG